MLLFGLKQFLVEETKGFGWFLLTILIAGLICETIAAFVKSFFEEDDEKGTIYGFLIPFPIAIALAMVGASFCKTMVPNAIFYKFFNTFFALGTIITYFTTWTIFTAIGEEYGCQFYLAVRWCLVTILSILSVSFLLILPINEILDRTSSERVDFITWWLYFFMIGLAACPIVALPISVCHGIKTSKSSDKSSCRVSSALSGDLLLICPMVWLFSLGISRSGIHDDTIFWLAILHLPGLVLLYRSKVPMLFSITLCWLIVFSFQGLSKANKWDEVIMTNILLSIILFLLCVILVCLVYIIRRSGNKD